MEDAYDVYEFGEDAIGNNIHVGNAKTKSNGYRNQETPPIITETRRSLRVKLKSFRVYNERLVKYRGE